MAAKLENTLSREEDEDERAERAREFRTNLNRRRPSRKRYTSGNPFIVAGEFECMERDGLIQSSNSELNNQILI